MPLSPNEITQRNLHLFFIFHKLRYTFIPQTILTEAEINLDIAYKAFFNNDLAGLN